MVADDAKHVRLVLRIFEEGAKLTGHLRAGGIGFPAKHAGQRTGDGEALYTTSNEAGETVISEGRATFTG